MEFIIGHHIIPQFLLDEHKVELWEGQVRPASAQRGRNTSTALSLGSVLSLHPQQHPSCCWPTFLPRCCLALLDHRCLSRCNLHLFLYRFRRLLLLEDTSWEWLELLGGFRSFPTHCPGFRSRSCRVTIVHKSDGHCSDLRTVVTGPVTIPDRPFNPLLQELQRIFSKAKLTPFAAIIIICDLWAKPLHCSWGGF